VFERYYNERFREIFGTPLEPGDGLGEEAVGSALARAGVAIPAALSDYYALAGRHWINDNHNRLRPIAQLEWIDDKLVFMEENQCVAFWGIPRADLVEADPVVWQGVNGEPIEWYAEDHRLSRFLMAMWKWTMSGEEDPPEAGQSDA
jgi:hypothetical protein